MGRAYHSKHEAGHDTRPRVAYHRKCKHPMEPMMADLGYTHSKLREAVRILARRPGQIRERLAYALAAVITISRDGFPDHLLGDFDDLMRTATAAEPSALTQTHDSSRVVAIR